MGERSAVSLSLALQIEACEFLQECVAHALQLDFEALFGVRERGLDIDSWPLLRRSPCHSNKSAAQ